MARSSKSSKVSGASALTPVVRIALLALLGLALLACAGLIFILRDWPAGLPGTSGSLLPCGEPVLTLGESSFSIRELEPAADGAVSFPTEGQGIAYKVQSPSGQGVLLALGPATQHLHFAASTKPGDIARITWGDCSSGLYSVKAVRAANLGGPDWMGQFGADLVIFVQADPSGLGVAILGELVLAVEGVPQVAEAEADAASLTDSPPPVIEQPTFQPPQCGDSLLSLGGMEFAIQPVAASADGSLPVPPEATGVAYWLEGSDPFYVFALSPTAENLALGSSLKEGDQASVQWADCNAATYTLLAPQADLAGGVPPLDPTQPGLMVFIQGGFTVQGEVAEEVLSAFQAPTPDPSQIQAEISLVEAALSGDGQSVQVEVSILNTGASAFTLRGEDVSLAPEGAADASPSRSRPSLPEDIRSGASKDFTFTFPRPASSPAVLRIFDVEFEIEF